MGVVLSSPTLSFSVLSSMYLMTTIYNSRTSFKKTSKSVDYDYKGKLFYTEDCVPKTSLAHIRCIVSPSTGSQKNLKPQIPAVI